jgi:branched-subunit amino acid transport protein
MADVDKLAARPAAYLNETGMPMLSGGLIFFFLGASVLIRSVLPNTHLAQEGTQMLGIACCGAVLWLSRRLTARLVFPRGGYVELPSRRRQYLSAIAASVAILVVGLIWGLRRFEIRFLWPALAVVAAVISLSEGVRQKMRPTVWFGVYLFCLAPVLWWIPGGNYERGSWLQVAVGLPVAGFGAIRLKRFLKANPMPLESTHE